MLSNKLRGVSPDQVVGQVVYTSGSGNWTCPAGVHSVSVVCVGPGYVGTGTPDYIGGSGGGLGYINNYPVVPGNTYAYLVGAAIYQNSYFVSNGVCNGGAANGTTGGSHVGDGGGDGGDTDGNTFSGGGGAGGYSGKGGTGVNAAGVDTSGSGGSAGGGRGYGTGGGGGVGLLGQGASGANQPTVNAGGFGGSGGGNGTGVGGLYGGGCGGFNTNIVSGSKGAIRIIWPGISRQFPSTNTGDM